jgi:hypothetical protein
VLSYHRDGIRATQAMDSHSMIDVIIARHYENTSGAGKGLHRAPFAVQGVTYVANLPIRGLSIPVHPANRANEPLIAQSAMARAPDVQ